MLTHIDLFSGIKQRGQGLMVDNSSCLEEHDKLGREPKPCQAIEYFLLNAMLRFFHIQVYERLRQLFFLHRIRIDGGHLDLCEKIFLDFHPAQAFPLIDDDKHPFSIWDLFDFSRIWFVILWRFLLSILKSNVVYYFHPVFQGKTYFRIVCKNAHLLISKVREHFDKPFPHKNENNRLDLEDGRIKILFHKIYKNTFSYINYIIHIDSLSSVYEKGVRNAG